MVNSSTYADIIRKDVFTTKGAYCGKVADVDLDMEKFRVRSLVVDAVRGSFLSDIVGEKRGVIVPFQIVQAIGDIIIIKHIHPTAAEEANAAEAEAA
ncbi:MAG: PRC-barrel domain-containing protein [Candidatus Aenigmarchaeota archaeon]|nr:PRC-barrel domain-containing protein [Candidatus Aenigmarchaeota archaeon]